MNINEFLVEIFDEYPSIVPIPRHDIKKLTLQE